MSTLLLLWIYAVVALQMNKAHRINSSAEVFYKQSALRCLNSFGFPKGTEERLFKTGECGGSNSFKAECSDEVVQKIQNATQEIRHFRSTYTSEDFVYFVSIVRTVWKVMMDVHASGTDSNGSVCWDVAAVEEKLKDFGFLESYYIWNTQYYVMAFVVVEIIFGLVANSLVLSIILKYQEMRTQPNMFILNLVIADLLVIASVCFGNIVVLLWPVTTVVFGLCRVVVFTINFACFGSVYSMVTLSFLRFLAVSAAPGSKALYVKQTFLKTPVVICSVWLVASVSGIPFILDSNENCVSRFDPGLLTSGLIVFCILPFVAATGLSIATTRRLKRSAQDMPGNGLDCEKWARERGARVILILIAAFTLSFVPPTLFSIIATQIDYKYNYTSYIHGIIMLLNTCINPVALFMCSGAFRKHLKMMLSSERVA